MTTFTKRYDLKRLCIVWMMILFCLFGAIIAFQGICPRKSAISNSIMQGIVSFGLFRIKFSMFAIIFTMFHFTFFTLMILFLVITHTRFAISSITIFKTFIFVKFRQWFAYLAFVTLFCYDDFRHNRFSKNGYCLEPIHPTRSDARLVLL